MKRAIVKSVFAAFKYEMQHYYPVGMEDLSDESKKKLVVYACEIDRIVN